MLFNEATKQAFVFPPKTGSHTVKNFLKSRNWREHGTLDWHSFIDIAIKKFPELNNYDIYGFFRDPLARFESSILFMKQHATSNYYFSELLRNNGVQKCVEEISYDDIVDLFDLVNTYDFFKILFLPQVCWLEHSKVEVLDFDKFENELQRIAGNKHAPILSYNVSTSFGKSAVTNRVKNFVRQNYADDYSYGKKVLGKEYLQ